MAKLTDEEKIDALREIADNNNWSFRDDYSGRFMYGRTCPGIVTDDPTACIEEAGAAGVRGASQDSMGRSAIVYWPSIKTVVKVSEEE